MGFLVRMGDILAQVTFLYFFVNLYVLFGGNTLLSFLVCFSIITATFWIIHLFKMHQIAEKT